MRWQGEFAFGDAWLAFRGASADNRFHAHAAVQFVVADTALCLVDEMGREFIGKAWAIRSGVRHCLRPASALTLVLADAQSRLAVELLAQLPLEPIAVLPEALQALLLAPGSLAERLAELDQQLPNRAAPLDLRVAAAIAQLERKSDGDAITVAAAHSGLSLSRLRALTREQFGVPLTKLLLWKKVRQACLSMAGGASLVDAAMDAGFADQAHLTRTMAEVIGLTPGEARGAAAATSAVANASSND